MISWAEQQRLIAEGRLSPDPLTVANGIAGPMGQPQMALPPEASPAEPRYEQIPLARRAGPPNQLGAQGINYMGSGGPQQYGVSQKLRDTFARLFGGGSRA